MTRIVLTGNHAAAYAVKLSRPDVISAYPITPQTSVIEKLSEFVENGELNVRFIRVESEHSAMAAVLGAASVGARVYTATSSQGLLYMYEVCWWAAGARLPIVMGVVTRAIAPPWSIWTDHNDILTLRDSGWIILFASDVQEVFDLTIQAYKIAETVNLPVAVGWDAFVVSHTIEPLDILSQEEVDKFLPKKKVSEHMLKVEDPFSLGNLTYPEDYMEFRYDMWKAQKKALDVISSVDEEYGELSGRRYGGTVEKNMCDDADMVLFIMGAASGDAIEAAALLRRKGLKVGVCRIRSMRPFPSDEVIKIAENVKIIGTFDRDISLGCGGIIGVEVRAAIKERGLDVPVIEYIGGIGGRDLRVQDFVEIFNDMDKLSRKGVRFERRWIGLKEEFEEGEINV
ncbi:MAG: pyruvate ferredoxin oxidoreductase [Thermoprotei archaeon]|nr:MAG: pyruvate ferredoxin oxidoreductase [Thermoprotei archaeon]